MPGPGRDCPRLADVLRVQNLARSAIRYTSEPYQMTTESSDRVPCDDVVVVEETETPPRIGTAIPEELPWNRLSSFLRRVLGVMGASELRPPRFGLEGPLLLASLSTVPTKPRRENNAGSVGELGPD